MKTDFPSLLNPGLHPMNVEQLRSLAVTPFPDDARRLDLFSRFMAWHKAFKALGLAGVAWVDGSFLTSKPEPSDIDLVIWGVSSTGELSEDQMIQAQALFDHASCKVIYGLDIYLEAPPEEQMIHREAYWRGFFGFCHDRATAKGFARVAI